MSKKESFLKLINAEAKREAPIDLKRGLQCLNHQ